MRRIRSARAKILSYVRSHERTSCRSGIFALNGTKRRETRSSPWCFPFLSLMPILLKPSLSFLPLSVQYYLPRNTLRPSVDLQTGRPCVSFSPLRAILDGSCGTCASGTLPSAETPDGVRQNRGGHTTVVPPLKSPQEAENFTCKDL